MRNVRIINKEVEVNAFYFAQGQKFKSYPRAITVDHKRYTFTDGLQMLVGIKESQDSYLSAEDDFSVRSGQKRTEKYADGASQQKIMLSAKRPAESAALQQIKQAGTRFVRFFEMTDGLNNYRLREQNDQWFLVSLKPITR